jgi:plastocyanin
VTRARLAILVCAVLALVTGCASGPDVPGPNDGSSIDFTIKATITVNEDGIDPPVTSIHTGDAITVKNTGSKDHNVTSDSIETGTLHPGESTTVFVTAEGTIELRDRLDPTHTARIEVTAANS